MAVTTKLSEPRNVIGGQRVMAQSGRSIPVTDPATGEEIATVPMSGPEDVNSAVAVAREAAVAWAATPIVQRARVMFRLHHLIERDLDHLAYLVTKENGKARSDALGEVTRGLEVVEFATGMPTHMQGGTVSNVARDVDTETRRYPLGVVAGITPFNFPAMIPLWMMPIAVAAGNAFILKPSEQTPLTPMHLLDLFLEAGVPEGVVNIVHGGADTVNAICDHPGIAAVSFVGSAPVARHVYTRGTAAGKRVQALAGAKNFLIVLDDADLPSAADAVFASAFGNAGERCLAGSVVLATEGIADRLVAELADRARSAPVGPGDDPRNVVTPVISPNAKQRICAAMDRALEEGASLVTGGRPGAESGLFIEPTIFDRVRPEMAVAREEIFGPVLAVIRVPDLDRAIEVANRSEFGNSSSLFTRSGKAAREFRERIEAGMLGINAGVPAPIGLFPFSGWKGSFFGDLHANGMDGVRFYTRMKAITTRWPGDY
ncbi:MAG TPA: CoA-acylating methylmalonate-semialdehyde dehydrogenase [Dehalococcoidia bacterium]|nr:CoA-acylating methylmalonate-semialdehyde dehydrogenase [Dehalococcoidia bacterium]